MVEDLAPANLPRRLGRYDIVGVLATHGAPTSSTILIATARSSEPGKIDTSLGLSYSPLPSNEKTQTFQRPVAIKRLSRQLTRKSDALKQFLDSARAATDIRHSNIAHIHEVGHTGDEVYLVMDYMMGESVATLMRELQSVGENLDFTIAATIVAEACAGLEAAHGLGILHERLTPHDIFVGYDGTVRVLDVGIAAPRARMIDDSLGAALELQYSSPERCQKEKLGPQTDVFSLGAMLWELNSGISPFERAKEADIIKAICMEPMVSPASVLRGLPEHVSRITMRALAREKERRYPTALALRQALLESVRRLGLGASPIDDLGHIMKRIFEKRVHDKEEMLRRIVAGKSISGLDVREKDASASLPPPRLSKPLPSEHDPDPKEPSVIIKPPTNPNLSEEVAAAMPPPPPTPIASALEAPPALVTSPDAVYAQGIDEPIAGVAPRPVRPMIIAAAVAALVIGGIALAVRLQGRGGPVATVPSTGPSVARPPPPPATPTPASSPLAVESAQPPAVPSSVVTVDPPVPSASSSSSATTTTMLEETVLHIETVPPHAAIFVGGVKKGTAPYDLNLPRSNSPVIVELRIPGYQTAKERVTPDVNQKLKITLDKAGVVRGPTTSTAPTGSAPYHKFQ
jgi:serine/threonine-protein kinase